VLLGVIGPILVNELEKHIRETNRSDNVHCLRISHIGKLINKKDKPRVKFFLTDYCFVLIMTTNRYFSFAFFLSFMLKVVINLPAMLLSIRQARGMAVY
jgi:hypothetical protein